MRARKSSLRVWGVRTFGVLSVLILASCASMPGGVPTIKVPPERIQQRGYLLLEYSILPLDEEGWWIGRRTVLGELFLGKYGKDKGEMFFIHVAYFTMPFKTEDEYIRLVKERRDKYERAAADRLHSIKEEVLAHTWRGTQCAKAYNLSNRVAGKQSEQTGDMIQETLTLTCGHPKNKDVSINVTYSHRYNHGKNDLKFQEKGWSVLNSLEFH